jgi:hypothetical protein
MRRNVKNLKVLIRKLREMKTQGSLETAKVAQIVKASRTLKRGLRENDRRLIEAAADELCRIFLKEIENDDQNDATDD